MQFTVIRNIEKERFKNVVKRMIGERKVIEFFDGDIEQQQYNCEILKVSVMQKVGYLIVKTNLENGWPYLESVIESNNFHAISIRFEKDRISEFGVWESGKRVRFVQAIKDSRWVWFEKGEIKAWEAPEFYKEKIIKNRLPSSLLTRYLHENEYAESIA